MSQNSTFLLTSRIYQKWKDWDNVRGGFIIRAHATLTLSLCLHCKHKRQLDNIFLIVSPKHQSLSQQPSPLVCLLGKRKKQLVVWVCQFQHIMEILQYFYFIYLTFHFCLEAVTGQRGEQPLLWANRMWLGCNGDQYYFICTWMRNTRL